MSRPDNVKEMTMMRLRLEAPQQLRMMTDNGAFVAAVPSQTDIVSTMRDWQNHERKKD
jgi:hypothetical protein